MAIPTHIGQRDPGDGTYNPGIQTNTPPVVRDNAIASAFTATITAADTLGSGREKYQQDLFGRSPLSGTLGFWNTSPDVTVTVFSTSVPSAPAITHTYSNLSVNQAITLPVLGFLSRRQLTTECRIIVTDSVNEFQTTVTLAPLPLTDSESGDVTGFPEIHVTKTATSEEVGDDLYFAVIAPQRAFIAFDRQGNVRWYVTAGDPVNSPEQCLPIYNNVRLSDGSFIGSDTFLDYYYTPADFGANEPKGQRELWRFDMTGRVQSLYFIRDRAHHSLMELPGENALLIASDYISTRNSGEGPNPDGANQGPSCEDCIAILDLATGFEKAYYDLRIILNFWRTPVPMDLSVPYTYDWAHVNQVDFDAGNGLIIASCRHQGAIIGIDRASGALRFISANQDDWQATETGIPTTDWSDLLLTPINPETNLPYDLSDATQKMAADSNFWTWGQHNVQSIAQQTPDSQYVDFSVFNNGNFRTRTLDTGVVASENASRCTHYQVNLETREVRQILEYGETELAATGYSPYVSTAHFYNFLDSDAAPRLLANFGGSIFQQNSAYPSGLPVTLEPGISDTQDPQEELYGTYQGRVIIQEVDLNTRLPLFEVQFTSGVYKTPPAGESDIRRVDLYSFRAYKMPLYA